MSLVRGIASIAASVSSSTPVPDDALVRAALLLGVAVLARPAVGLLAQLAAAIPGRLGRLGSRAADALRPGLARRLLAAVLGLGVPLVSIVSTTPAASARTIDPGAHELRPWAELASSEAAPLRLAARAPKVDIARTTPGTTTGNRTEVGPGASTGPDVVVASGDSLWDIARRHLPRGSTSSAVAAAWPQWYAANRDRIGPDPALLRVGTPLRVPALRRTGTSASQHHRPLPGSAPSPTSAQSLDPDRR